MVQMFERSEFIGTRYYSDAAFFDRRIVEVDDGGGMVLDVVAVKELSWQIGYFGTGGPALVGDSFGTGLLQPVGDLMCLVAEMVGFVAGKDGFGEDIAMFCIEVLFLGGETGLGVGFYHGFPT